MQGDYITSGRIQGYVCEVLQRKGVSEEDARLSADVLVGADLRGIRSHGVAGGTGLDNLVTKIDAGLMKVDFKPNIHRKYPTILTADAEMCLPYPLSFRMCEQLKEVAAEYGMAKGYVSNAQHYGIAGVYTEFITQEGDFQGKSNCTTAAIVRLLGGTKPRLGTNLIAHSIPYSHDGKIAFLTVDMATTVHAASWAIKALKDGSDLPFDYLYYFDSEGRPNKSTADFFKGGSIAPLGSAYDLNGRFSGVPYKGIILAQMIEADCALAGGQVEAIGVENTNPNRNVTHVFEAQKLDVAYSREEALRKIDHLVGDWRKYGDDTTLMPGEKEHKQRQQSVTEGIWYNDAQLKRLGEIGTAVGVRL